MSYDDTLATDLDKVRMHLGDTSNDGDTELVTDDHIDAVLTYAGSVAGAVATIARELLARFANEPKTVTLPNGLSVGFARDGWEIALKGALGGTLVSAGTATISIVDARYTAETTTDEFARPSGWW